MRYLWLLILSACGSSTLTEGVYLVKIIETSNTCPNVNTSVGEMCWDIIRIDQHYGITHEGNGLAMSCIENEDQNITCSKDGYQTLKDCDYLVSQQVVLEPQEESFSGTLNVQVTDCNEGICEQTAVLEGEYQPGGCPIFNLF
jgi:hypothetical protein